MPNWCSNSISIDGPLDKIQALWTEAELKDCLLEIMTPIGEWDYGQAVESWGTKWDVNIEGLEFEDNGDGTASITGWFDSAWSPPLQAFATYCDKNPDVSAEVFYQEEGMCFVGRWSNTDGDDYYEYGDATSATIRDFVPDYLVDEFDLEYNLEQWEETQ
jgi:hypothetical protein